MAKDALTVLREARELISDPKRWTTGVYAKDKEGNACFGDSSGAVCWCAEGAVHCVSAGRALGDYQAARGLLHVAAMELHDAALWYVNDCVGHEATLRMFDAAIASAEKEARS